MCTQPRPMSTAHTHTHTHTHTATCTHLRCIRMRAHHGHPLTALERQRVGVVLQQHDRLLRGEQVERLGFGRVYVRGWHVPVRLVFNRVEQSEQEAQLQRARQRQIYICPGHETLGDGVGSVIQIHGAAVDICASMERCRSSLCGGLGVVVSLVDVCHRATVTGDVAIEAPEQSHTAPSMSGMATCGCGARTHHLPRRVMFMNWLAHDGMPLTSL